MPSWQRYRAQTRRLAARYLEEPLARLFKGIGLSPGGITVLGLLLSGATAYLLSAGQFLIGALLLLLSGVMDMADGAMARLYGRSTPFGALLDSTADRIAEAVVFLGLLVFYLNTSPVSIPAVVLIHLALVGSFMVSYLRARGEGLGVDCGVGVMTRPERVILLVVGLLADQVAVALGIMAALSSLTSLHRFWHIQRELSQR